MNKAFAYQLDGTSTDYKVLLYKALPFVEGVLMVEWVVEEEEGEEVPWMVEVVAPLVALQVEEEDEEPRMVEVVAPQVVLLMVPYMMILLVVLLTIPHMVVLPSAVLLREVLWVVEVVEVVSWVDLLLGP